MVPARPPECAPSSSKGFGLDIYPTAGALTTIKDDAANLPKIPPATMARMMARFEQMGGRKGRAKKTGDSQGQKADSTGTDSRSKTKQPMKANQYQAFELAFAKGQRANKPNETLAERPIVGTNHSRQALPSNIVGASIVCPIGHVEIPHTRYLTVVIVALVLVANHAFDLGSKQW
jgi:hypothetical protein